jgi:hypothetical protein
VGGLLKPMSTHTTGTVHLSIAAVPTAEELLLGEIRRSCTALGAIPSSAAIAALGTTVSSTRSSQGPRTAVPQAASSPIAPSLARLEARSASVAALPGATEILQLAAPAPLSRAQSLLAESRLALANGDPGRAESLARQGDRALRGSVTSAVERLRPEERAIAARSAHGALQDMGCAVSMRKGNRFTTLWAERDERVLAVVVSDGGHIEVDLAGCEGGYCRPLWREFAEAMAARGAAVEVTDVLEHGDSSGGVLVQRAALAAPTKGALADGLLIQAEHPDRVFAPRRSVRPGPWAALPAQRMGGRGR